MNATRSSGKVIIVGPREWVFDKLVASYLWIMFHLGELNFENVEFVFRKNQHPAKKLWELWKNLVRCLILDLGMEKYQFLFAGSSTERVAEMIRAKGEPGGILDQLIQITVENNQTGYLKHGHHDSVVGLLRELYKLGKRAGYGRRDVAIAVLQLIHAWVRAKAMVGHHQRDEASLFVEPQLAELLKKTGKKFQDFTLSQYVLHLWVLGYEVEEIQSRLDYFYRGKELVAEIRRNLPKEFEAMDRDHKRVFAHGRAILLVTANRFLAGWVLNKARNRQGRLFDLVMVRRESDDKNNRNVVFLARTPGGNKKSELDLGYLGALLIILEGHSQRNLEWGRWYYDGRIEGLFNGTDLHGVPCTQLSDELLTLLVDILVFYRQEFNLGRLMKDLRRCVPDGRHDDDDWDAIAEIITDRFPNELYKLVLEGQDWKSAWRTLRGK